METMNKQYQPTVEPAKAGQNVKPFFQPKLTINQPNDAYEVEADAMADKVMRMEMPGNGIQLKPLPISSVQRKCAHCEEEQKMQRKEMNSSETTADAGLESYVGSLNSGGQALSPEARSFYEPRFGYDFSNVKIHTDTIAAKSAQSINALAYTSGNNIVFNSGQYSPNTDSGKRLLGHELTHVVQQGKGIATKKIQRLSITPTKSFTQGACGERSVYWNFESSVPAPKGGGYIIQQIQNLENIKDCPADDIDFILIKPTFTFWEAWWVAEGDTIQEKHKQGIVDFTDRSSRPGSDGKDKSGLQVSIGEVRFFSKNITGDLGKEDQLSSDPAIAAVWKPGTKGGVARSGWLPSTYTMPSWWGSSIDGPKQRWANSWWNCCGKDESKHKSECDASPK